MLEMAEFFRERRKVVSIDEMPKYLQDATVAFEDKRFYTHSGVDFRGILRALSSNISHGDLKGEGGTDYVAVDAATGRPVLESRIEIDGESAFREEWPPLPPGDYRLTVATTDSDSDRAPVHSLFIVADAVEGPP